MNIIKIISILIPDIKNNKSRKNPVKQLGVSNENMAVIGPLNQI